MSGLLILVALAAEIVRADSLPPPINPAIRAVHARHRSFAECLATVDWSLVKPVFDVGIGTTEEQRIFNRAASKGRCQNTNVGHFWNTELRHSIAAARYRAVYSNIQLPVAVGTSITPDRTRFAWASSTGNGPWQAFQALATCLAGNQPKLVHSVLMAVEDSADEREKMGVLAQNVGPCLRAGQSIRISQVELRSWLAEAQYQMLSRRVLETSK
jgi:hypothetical protein